MAKERKGGGVFSTTAKTAERSFAIKEAADVLTNFIDRSKDHPLVKTWIEGQFRELREEIVTFRIISELDPKRVQRINRLLRYLKSKGQISYIQDIQNITFTQIIFDTIGIPLSQARAKIFENILGPEKKDDKVSSKTEKTNGKESHLKFYHELVTEETKKFLENLADKIGEGDSEEVYQEAKDFLASHRLIGQKPWKNLFEMLIKQIEQVGIRLPGWLKENTLERVSEKWHKEFPEDRPGGFDFLREKLEASQRRRGLL